MKLVCQIANRDIYNDIYALFSPCFPPSSYDAIQSQTLESPIKFLPSFISVVVALVNRKVQEHFLSQRRKAIKTAAFGAHRLDLQSAPWRLGLGCRHIVLQTVTHERLVLSNIGAVEEEEEEVEGGRRLLLQKGCSNVPQSTCAVLPG